MRTREAVGAHRASDVPFVQHGGLLQREREREREREVVRAASFFWRLKNAFGGKAGKRQSFGYKLAERPIFNANTVLDVIRSAHERLKDVLVFNEDFGALIARLDRPATFFYCDPPYYAAGSCYEHDMAHADHERLARQLSGIRGKFLLSYGDHKIIRGLYDGWATIETVETSYSVGNKTKGRQRITELLIRNY